MFAVKAKIYGVLHKQSISIAFVETSCQRQKAPIFLAFIGHHLGVLFPLVTTRVVHLLKRTEKSLITESDLSGPNHRIGPGFAGRA